MRYHGRISAKGLSVLIGFRTEYVCCRGDGFRRLSAILCHADKGRDMKSIFGSICFGLLFASLIVPAGAGQQGTSGGQAADAATQTVRSSASPVHRYRNTSGSSYGWTDESGRPVLAPK